MHLCNSFELSSAGLVSFTFPPGSGELISLDGKNPFESFTWHELTELAQGGELLYSRELHQQRVEAVRPAAGQLLHQATFGPTVQPPDYEDVLFWLGSRTALRYAIEKSADLVESWTMDAEFKLHRRTEAWTVDQLVDANARG